MNLSNVMTNKGMFLVEDDGMLIKSVKYIHHDKVSEKMSLIATQFQREFNEYMEGKRKSFTLQYQIEGTPFQVSVLKAMASIPYGKTISYQELAQNAAYPKAVRAVGTVCKNNRLPFIIPCHRVIKSSGEIGNYALGRDYKSSLIDIERQG